MNPLPQKVNKILSALEENGYEAYLVGGCVRDALLGKRPKDYDIATNALPGQMAACFGEFKVIETGLKHGTLTVISQGEPVEVTTYRVDGEYLDHRRPESVSFTASLEEDLARRDFTVNAMAYSVQTGLLDPFGGQADLKAGVLRCVGEASKRFSEDALRILRALRFSSVLGFALEPETKKAVLALRNELRCISAERISAELDKLLAGENVCAVLVEYAPVIAVFIPEMERCIGFAQHNKYHRYDVWEHICVAVASSRNDRLIRLTMLLHDIAKPECFYTDEDGEGHFYNHERLSARWAEDILRRLRYDRSTVERVSLLIGHHYFTPVNQEKPIKKQMREIGPEAFFQLLDVQRADAMAKQTFCLDRLPVLDAVEETARAILLRKDCLTRRELAVNGNDLLELGFQGKAIGHAMDSALEQVVQGTLPNERAALLTFLEGML